MSDENPDGRKVRVYVMTGFAFAKHEDFYDLPDGWDDMTPAEQEKELDEMANDYMSGVIEFGAHVVGEDEPK